VEKISDLISGMKLTGVITNITAFGAFVDIGVHQDGLVHLSEMADRYIKTPADVVKVNQKVEVTVLAVNEERNRISLSMKKTPGEKPARDKVNDRVSSSGAESGRKFTKGMPVKGKDKKRDKEQPKPFNNPFADALKGIKKDPNRK
jgi:uncharacterized protein